MKEKFSQFYSYEFQYFSGNLKRGREDEMISLCQVGWSMEPVARVWSCSLSPRTPPRGESTAFWEGIIQPFLPFVSRGQRGYHPACSICGQRGTREPCCHLFPTDLCPNRGQVAHSAHLPTRFEPHTHTAKGSDAGYQPNIINALLSDGVHCMS